MLWVCGLLGILLCAGKHLQAATFGVERSRVWHAGYTSRGGVSMGMRTPDLGQGGATLASDTTPGVAAWRAVWSAWFRGQVSGQSIRMSGPPKRARHRADALSVGIQYFERRQHVGSAGSVGPSRSRRRSEIGAGGQAVARETSGRASSSITVAAYHCAPRGGR